MTTGALESKLVRDPEFLLAIRDKHRAIAWAVLDVEATYRDPFQHAYTRKVAASAYRRSLDDARLRAFYRSYKRVVADEGSHANAVAYIAVRAVGAVFCVLALITLIRGLA